MPSACSKPNEEESEVWVLVPEKTSLPVKSSIFQIKGCHYIED